MRRYETIAIIDPDLTEEDRAQVLQRTTDLIPKEGGFLILLDEWGNRKLAYEIKKKARGYYVRIDYCGSGPLVNEMERFFRIDDKVLKFMTVLLEKDADAESIKEEMAKAKSEAEARAKSEAEAIAKSEAEARAKSEAEAKAKSEAETEAARKLTEETENIPETTDELQEKDDVADTDNIPQETPIEAGGGTEQTETDTEQTESIKEEQ
jgi:small subunit ribosomal protein S6